MSGPQFAQAIATVPGCVCELRLNLTVAAEWDLALAVNVKSYAFGLKHASIAMAAQSEKSPSADKPHDIWPFAVVNIASTGGERAVPDMAPYSTTKGAVIALTKSCAVDLAKQRIR